MSTKNRLKLGVIGLAGLVAASTFLGDGRVVEAASNGPSPSHTGAPNEDTCVSCHADFSEPNVGPGSVTITGIPANYTPGQVIDLTVVLADNTATVYGFQLTAADITGAKAGTFTLPAQSPAQIKILPADQNSLGREYVEHTSDGIIPTVIGSKSWTFTWTAPPQNVGRVNFYVAGNGANSDGSTSGDYIYTASVMSAPFYSVSGQVRDPAGIAVRNVPVRISGNGITRTDFTDNFGLYEFPNIPGGAQYTVAVASKRYQFDAKTPTIDSNLTNLDFQGSQ